MEITKKSIGSRVWLEAPETRDHCQVQAEALICDVNLSQGRVDMVTFFVPSLVPAVHEGREKFALLYLHPNKFTCRPLEG